MPSSRLPISEKDSISIGLIMAVLGAMALGVTWGLRLEARVDVTDSRLNSNDDQRKEDLEGTRFYAKTLQEVNERLSRIEGAVGVEKRKGR